MKSNRIYFLLLLITTGLLLNACGSMQSSTDISMPKDAAEENGLNVSLAAQVAAIVQSTQQPAATAAAGTVIVPVTGNPQNNDLTTATLVFALVMMAGLAFIVALIALVMRTGRPSYDATTRPPYDDTKRTN